MHSSINNAKTSLRIRGGRRQEILERIFILNIYL